MVRQLNCNIAPWYQQLAVGLKILIKCPLPRVVLKLKKKKMYTAKKHTCVYHISHQKTFSKVWKFNFCPPVITFSYHTSYNVNGCKLTYQVHLTIIFLEIDVDCAGAVLLVWFWFFSLRILVLIKSFVGYLRHAVSSFKTSDLQFKRTLFLPAFMFFLLKKAKFALVAAFFLSRRNKLLNHSQLK